MPAGNWTAGERGIAALPDRVEEFRAGVGRALQVTQALNVRQLNCLVGKRDPNVPLELLDAIGYTGYVGLEYVPPGTTEESLAWVAEYGYAL